MEGTECRVLVPITKYCEARIRWCQDRGIGVVAGSGLFAKFLSQDKGMITLLDHHNGYIELKASGAALIEMLLSEHWHVLLRVHYAKR